MSFDRGRHAATTDAPSPHNHRREYLAALAQEVTARKGLGCGLIERRGVTTLSVVRHGPAPRRLVEVACDYSADGWWYTWAADGRSIAPIDNVAGTVDTIALELLKAKP